MMKRTPTVHGTAASLFRELPYVTPTRTRWTFGWGWVWPLGALMAVLSLLVLAGWLDQVDELRHREQVAKVAAELERVYQLGRAEGRAEGHAEMIASAEAAWQAAGAERDHCARTRK